MRYPLAIGTNIKLTEIGTEHEKEFLITDVIGMGASCIVYTAVYTDTEKNEIIVRLKEFFPVNLDISRNGYSLTVSDNCHDEYNEMLDCFAAGYRKQLDFLKKPAQTNSISSIYGIFAGNNTKYIAMNCSIGTCLTDKQNYSVIDIFRIIRAVALQIKHFHESGYLYLDLKPSNLFLYPETPDMVMLFDFDSVISKADVINHIDRLSYTEDWAAPELCRQQIDKIDERADIYALGALLLFLLFKRKTRPSDRRRFADFSEDIENSILAAESPELKKMVTDILKKTLSSSVNCRFNNCGELLDVIEPYLDSLLAPKPYLKSYLPMGNNYFCGRDIEIKEIHEVLQDSGFVVIHGIGGIGKSELAKHYAMHYISDYDAAVFVRFHKNIIQTITSDTNFPIVNCKRSDDEEEAEYFTRKVKILQEICTSRHLIILDNFDTEDCDALDTLTGLHCKILVTSRVDYSDVFRQYDVGILQEFNDLFNLITYYYKEELDEENVNAVENIIYALEGHTLALELIAKHMQNMNIKPAEMIHTLIQSGITSGDKGKVRNVKDGSLKSRTAYEHIASLFSIFGLSEDVKQILRYAALIGPNYIKRDFFIDFCKLTKKLKKAFESAVIYGWIQILNYQDSTIITLHPLISDVLCEELKPDIDHCENFILSAAEFVQKIEDYDYEQRELHIAWLDHTARNIHGNSTKITFLLDNINMVYLVEEDYEGRMWCNQRIIDIIYALHEEENFPRQILSSYLELKNIANSIGDFEQEQLYIQKIKELGLEEGLESLSNSNCQTELENDNYSAAKQFAEESINYTLKSDDPWRIAKAYSQLGEVERKFENDSAADSAYKTAAKYIEDYLIDHPDEIDNPDTLAMLYGDAADIQSENGNYTIALKHYQKQLELLTQEHGEITGKVKDVYIMISSVYAKIDNHEMQLIYLEKSCDISEKVYGKLHPETILSYHALYSYYLSIWQISQDKEPLNKCNELIQLIFNAVEYCNGEDSPEAAEWNMEYSNLLRLMDDEESCYFYMDKAFQIYEEFLDEDGAEWINLYCQASDSFLHFGDRETSLKYLEFAIELCELNDEDELLEYLIDYKDNTFYGGNE